MEPGTYVRKFTFHQNRTKLRFPQILYSDLVREMENTDDLILPIF